MQGLLHVFVHYIRKKVHSFIYVLCFFYYGIIVCSNIRREGLFVEIHSVTYKANVEHK
jgi:hypothetical protein